MMIRSLRKASLILLLMVISMKPHIFIIDDNERLKVSFFSIMLLKVRKQMYYNEDNCRLEGEFQ